MAFHAFQFDPGTDRPFTVLGDPLAVFAATGVDSYPVDTSLATGQDELDGRTSASLLGDPAAAADLQATARRIAAQLSY